MQGRIAFVPEVLPIAPRPIPGELISSWLLRVSFANGLTLPQLIEAIETRFPGLSLRSAFIDDRLSPGARFALAKFMRLPEDKVKAHELAQQFPMLPPEWILRPVNWDPGSPDRFAQGRARYAFCPLCLREMISGTQTVWIRSEWALVFQTHCARHRIPLFERCAACFEEDPLLPITNGSPAIASCWKCGSALLSYTAGFPPNPRWAGQSSVQAFFEKLRNRIQYLTTPTDDRVPPFFRIIDADPHRRHYLFGSQRPETRVETMSWYCRFLLLMTLARQLN